MGNQTKNQKMNQQVEVFEKLAGRKHCVGCDEIKTMDYFTKSHSRCKKCMVIVNRLHYEQFGKQKHNKRELKRLERLNKQAINPIVEALVNQVIEPVIPVI